MTSLYKKVLSMPKLLAGTMVFTFLLLPRLAGASNFDHRHALLGEVLAAHVHAGRVDYGALQKSPTSLADYIRNLQEISREEYGNSSDAQKIAFWINAYNAATLQVILDHYPLQKGLSWKAVAFPKNSIWQIPKVWDRTVLNVFGEDISLNYIEHEILRKKFQEPRVHFALVCASIGCPDLRKEPYVAEMLDAQLADQVSRFLKDEEKFQHFRKKNSIHLSPILKWFREDFEARGGVIEFLKRHLPEEVANTLSGSTKIKWRKYDWSLNERVDE